MAKLLCDFTLCIQLFLNFVFVKVVAQVAGFIRIVVAAGIGMNSGYGFGYAFASFLLLGSSICNDNVASIDAAVGGTAAMATIVSEAKGLAGTRFTLISQVNLVITSRLFLSQY
ncbi:hypothetical protein [Snodgrassella alvi]|uniref:hypothetical protein n=1 Tax=Snodgrassella alvi TaxID=1196083 RepID=UPI002147C66C|nr:hypothetical protein [Snodgrassella alvi]